MSLSGKISLHTCEGAEHQIGRNVCALTGISKTVSFGRCSKTAFNVLSLFWSNKSGLMRSSCCLCVCLSPLSTFNCLN
jgi:hypothetical protein